jgi:hypothetical protein
MAQVPTMRRDRLEQESDQMKGVRSTLVMMLIFAALLLPVCILWSCGK